MEDHTKPNTKLNRKGFIRIHDYLSQNSSQAPNPKTPLNPTLSSEFNDP